MTWAWVDVVRDDPSGGGGHRGATRVERTGGRGEIEVSSRDQLRLFAKSKILQIAVNPRRRNQMMNEGDSSLAATPVPGHNEQFRTVASFVVGAVALCGILAGVWGTFNSFEQGTTRADMHPLQIMDLFYASGGALLLVTLFRTTDGPVELKMGFLQFKGASGPIIMWVIVFISICAGMKMLNLAG